MNEIRKKINFHKDMRTSTIRNLVNNNCYLEFGKHEDLRAVCLCCDDTDIPQTDWQEMTFIVPTEWLRNCCKDEFNETDLDYFLQEKYTSEESEVIFIKALNERKVVMVDFC